MKADFYLNEDPGRYLCTVPRLTIITPEEFMEQTFFTGDNIDLQYYEENGAAVMINLVCLLNSFRQ